MVSADNIYNPNIKKQGVSPKKKQKFIKIMKNTNKKEVLQIETFLNPFPGRDYTVEMECPEFTCLCPKTGQPDFATLHISYIPEKLCLELKSLKLYLASYRNEGGFHEKVTNIVLDDLVSACKPRKMKILADFNVRGGIYTSITVEYLARANKSNPRRSK